jgi:hypothetical protein
MVKEAEAVITKKHGLDWSDVELHSKASIWANHVAVILFLSHPEASLVLYTPCAIKIDSE